MRERPGGSGCGLSACRAAIPGGSGCGLSLCIACLPGGRGCGLRARAGRLDAVRSARTDKIFKCVFIIVSLHRFAPAVGAGNARQISRLYTNREFRRAAENAIRICRRSGFMATLNQNASRITPIYFSRGKAMRVGQPGARPEKPSRGAITPKSLQLFAIMNLTRADRRRAPCVLRSARPN